jgi:hypothetical protein
VACEAADREPLVNASHEFTLALDLEEAAAASIDEAQLPKVNPRDRFEVRPKYQVVTKTGVAVADIRIIASQHEPVTLLLAAELEAHDPALRRQLVEVKVVQDRPHQDVAVEVLWLKVEPVLAPDSKGPYQLRELAPSFGQVICRASACGIRTGLNDSHTLETPQALAKQAWRHPMKALQDLAEVVMARQQLAEDQRRPTLGEYLGRSRHWTELAVSRHGLIVFPHGDRGKY